MLSAPATSYSHDPRKSMQDPPLAGLGISLLTLVQARNNARVMVAGSMNMFSDAYFEAEVALSPSGSKVKSGNKDFTLAVAQWTLQERAVLHAENLRHRLMSSPPDSPSPSLYRVTDDVEFAVDIFEYESGQRRPYKGNDLQVEFVMLDPYVRLGLQHDGTGTFSVQFKVPDVYGVFKYVLEYQHAGYSYIHLSKQVPVRPFRHNEFERFLVCAYPYYASAASSCVAFFVLGWFFLYHKD
ncbi:dolichyl-diphosphooligosaccharide--protein glycosyltransferase 48 kDa subunit precursor [Dunaliella salina]|uniref:Dolichyl-diphosphooligosaccharide--protein glycosyltransferase 48 kDa subunit n=1 Tax=Dunaliella salina TaxID=3046 RepID=A0ABQ7FWS1_DUNSA|nr:dolichyl-diphosphooligosaccharide--protein glycosyltransferase 48 kDa subunit precursor [Dunaliella salina]|eukprot:KAF5826804.1 dolichyl-diphosphooligosaccharide--protein glycosyltransferase 48 kDa subunit precursor [Dunaliella salina]